MWLSSEAAQLTVGAAAKPNADGSCAVQSAGVVAGNVHSGQNI